MIEIVASKMTKPNLSELLDPGTNTLNAYHLAGQLLTLYGVAQNISQEEDLEKWAFSDESLLANIGDIFEVWRTICDQVNYGINVVESPAVKAKIFSLSHRMSQIEAATNQWTPISRMPSILMLCEIRWQRIIEAILETNQNCSIKFGSILTDSRERHRKLQEVWRFYRDEKLTFEGGGSPGGGGASEVLFG